MTTRQTDMPKQLRLETLTKLIEMFTAPPELIFLNMFGTDQWPSDVIKWETRTGNMGMSPFVSPGAPAPLAVPTGIAESGAKAAFWKEKVHFGEEILNNLRMPGTDRDVYTAEKQIGEATQMLKNRCDRRKEWMFCKMFADGGFTYLEKGGTMVAVDYQVLDDFFFELGSTRKWDDGESKNILEDAMDFRLTFANHHGGVFTKMFMTQEVLNVMIMDSGIQNLLEKSAFGNGDLFTRPNEVLGALLNIGQIVVYDEMYQVRAWLTSPATASSTTDLIVDDASDFEAGDTILIVDQTKRTDNYEELTIDTDGVDIVNNTITVATAPTKTYVAGNSYISVRKKFLPTDRIILLADQVQGHQTAEFAEAPFGMTRSYGMVVDTKDTWDPDGLFVRVQNKGLPVLYHNDAVMSIKVIG